MNSALGKPGFMVVLSSPSGAGKTSIAHALLQRCPNLVPSISATTRPPRGQEQDGRDYFFKTHAEFEQMIRDDALLEYAKVYTNYYGTPRAMVEEALSNGKDVLFDIDWQGTQQLRLQKRGAMVSIFILPPSIPILRDRLSSRGTDTPAVVTARMRQAWDEISHASEYDYMVINHDLDDSITTVESILRAEKHRKNRASLLPEYLRARQAEWEQAEDHPAP